MSVEPARWTAEERAAFYARRESRNRALGILLFTLVALFFGITVVRMTDQISGPPAGTQVGGPPAAAVPAR